MDRTAKTTTDEDGRFRFDSVMAGIRGIQLPGERNRWVCVRVESGKEVDVSLGGWIHRTCIEIRAQGLPVPDRMDGALVGLDEVSIFQGIQLDAGRVEVADVLPGRYLLLTRSGKLAIFEIKDEYATGDLGPADLTIWAEPQTRVFVVPDVDNELVELLGGRISSQVVDDSGFVRIAPLPGGRYKVGVDRKGIFAKVNVLGPGTEARIE